jgi:hypothetical protein
LAFLSVCRWFSNSLILDKKATEQHSKDKEGDALRAEILRTSRCQPTKQRHRKAKSPNLLTKIGEFADQNRRICCDKS